MSITAKISKENAASKDQVSVQFIPASIDGNGSIKIEEFNSYTYDSEGSEYLEGKKKWKQCSSSIYTSYIYFLINATSIIAIINTYKFFKISCSENECFTWISIKRN